MIVYFADGIARGTLQMHRDPSRDICHESIVIEPHRYFYVLNYLLDGLHEPIRVFAVGFPTPESHEMFAQRLNVEIPRAYSRRLGGEAHAIMEAQTRRQHYGPAPSAFASLPDPHRAYRSVPRARLGQPPPYRLIGMDPESRDAAMRQGWRDAYLRYLQEYPPSASNAVDHLRAVLENLGDFPPPRDIGYVCVECKATQLEVYFKSDRDGRILCQKCFDAKQEKQLAKEVAPEKATLKDGTVHPMDRWMA